MIKKILSILLIVTMLICNTVTMAFAQPIANLVEEGQCGEQLYWRVYEEGLLEIYGSGDMYDYSDSSRPPWDKYKTSIKTIILDEEITSIGDYAFYGFSGIVENLNLPDNLTTIGASAFEMCSGYWGELVIPQNVTSIGNSAFEGCSGFNGRLYLPNNLATIGEYTFYGCSGLNGSLAIPKSVTSIGKKAFNGCSGFTGTLSVPEDIYLDSTYGGPFGDMNVTLSIPFEANNALNLVSYARDINLKYEVTGITSIGYKGEYDGKGHCITVNVPEGGTVTYSTNEDGEFTSVSPEIKNVGIHTVYYKVMKDDVTMVTSSENINISTKSLKYVSATLEYNSVTYDGTAKTPAVIISGLTQGVDFDVEYYDNVDAGAASAVITGKTNCVDTIVRIFEINKASMKGVTVEGYDGIYDGLPHTIRVIAPEGAKVTYSTSSEGVYSEVAPTLTDVGTKNVYYKIEKKNYETKKGYATVNISQATMDGIVAKGYEGLYDGKAHGPNITVPEGATITYSSYSNVGFTTEPPTITDVGTKTVYFRISMGNYKTTTGSVELVVTPAKMEGIVVTGYEGVYDGNMHYANAIIPDGATIMYDSYGTGNYSSTVASFGIAGTARIKYKVEKPNYETVTGTVVFKIDKADISSKEVKLSYYSIQYDGFEKCPSVTVVGLDDTTLYKVEYKNNRNVGTATVVITATNSNYTGTIEKNFEITENYSEFAGGIGSEERPFKISTKEQLNNVRKYKSSYFVLINDIYFTEADFSEDGEFYNNGKGWEPIGTEGSVFSGVFDGRNYSIYGLAINSSNECSGMFGCTQGTIKNLKLKEGLLISSNTIYAGGIAGRLESGKIINCTYEGNIDITSTTSIYVGGIVGFSANDCKIENCISDTNIDFESNSDAYVGGIVAFGSNPISNCKNIGTILGVAKNTYIGGIAGFLTSGGEISNCENEAKLDIVAKEYTYIGGIVGHSINVEIRDCFNAGEIKVEDNENLRGAAGGAVGDISGGSIKNFYNVGKVNAVNSTHTWLVTAGNIVGYIENTTLKNCYGLKGCGAKTEGTTELTSDQMENDENFKGFDFINVWGIDSTATFKYPYLKLFGLPEIEIDSEEPTFGVLRLAGSDRFSTSAQISKGFIADGEAEAIVIVNGLDFPDALSATPFAAKVGAPILMVNGPRGTISDSVINEINRIDPDHNAKVYFIGGEGAVSEGVANNLVSLGYSKSSIERVAGADRYSTAIAVANKVNGKVAYIANGAGYADALGGGSAAAINDGVILFTASTKLTAATKNHLIEHGYDKIVILGGDGVVSTKVENELKEICTSVERLAGLDRYETSLEVAKKYFDKTETIVVATGTDFADALAGGPIAAELDAPIILVNPKRNISQSLIDYIHSSEAKNVVVLGGEGVVSASIENQLSNAL